MHVHEESIYQRVYDPKAEGPLLVEELPEYRYTVLRSLCLYRGWRW